MRLATAVVLSAALAAAADAAEVDATSRIDAVTVFPSGAEITRTSKISLDKGEHTLVFKDLPPGAVESSIRVEGRASGKLDIGSVDTRRVHVPRSDAEAVASERRRIEDEIEKLKDQRSGLDADIQAAETQKSLIANLTQLPTRPAPPAGAAERGEDWTSVLGLIRTASAESQRAILEAQVKVREVDRAITDLGKKLAEIAPARDERTEVKVYVSAPAPVEADLVLRYQVRNASWTPLYDARLSTGTKTAAPKLELVRRATITQRTSESWEEVAVTLSTTRPAAGASAPELSPLTVDFEPPPEKVAPVAAPAPRMSRSPVDSMAEESRDEEADGLGAVAQRKIAVEQQEAVVAVAPFQALFAVPGRISVPNTGEAKRVQLATESLEPQLTVRTTPKEDAKAYLYAKLLLPKSTPLLAGAVSLFRDGTFVGTGHLPILSPGEEHDLGFGVDDLVRVRHAVAEEKRGETGLITTSRTDSRDYRITVKNLHERAIGAVILDQIPVSQNQDIKVELVAKTYPSRQNVEDRRGVLAWDLKLDPDQEQVIDFGYRVSWPSAKSVIYRH